MIVVSPQSGHRGGTFTVGADQDTVGEGAANVHADLIHLSRPSFLSDHFEVARTRGVSTSPRPIRRSSSARTRSETALTTSAPSCVGSIWTRKGRLPKGASITLTIASATAETPASGGTIEAKPLRTWSPKPV